MLSCKFASSILTALVFLVALVFALLNTGTAGLFIVRTEIRWRRERGREKKEVNSIEPFAREEQSLEEEKRLLQLNLILDH